MENSNNNNSNGNSNNRSDSNNSSNRSKLWIAGLLLLIVMLGFFLYRNSFGQELTGNVVAEDSTSVQKANLYMSNYEYKVEPSILKKGVPVKMTVNAASLRGCARNVVIKDFGIRKTISSVDNIIEFIPDKTGMINIACSMNMYRGTFTIVE
ncbi:cupredoxin domain-containing protein [Candidatus Woesearchaeota archaeon]|nr:cupredoxin domain-containing protein [Candidatus Woesearchaeota archaeon]